MSLWSISAAKKKDEIPGSSKWIRNELFTLHDLIANDVEQFAYSVASEFTWIDEQMEEILNASEKYVYNGYIKEVSKLTFDRNPKLLLESPSKLRGKDSPVKQLRDHALALKSPLKEVDTNVAKLSPIKFNKDYELLDSPSKNQSTYGNRTIHKIKSPVKPIPLLATKSSSLLKSAQSPFLDAVKEPQVHKSSTRSSNKSSLSMESLHESTPIKHSSTPNSNELKVQEPKQQQDAKVEDPEEKHHDTPESAVSSQPTKMDLKSKLNEDEGEDDGDYDASMEDISFQAIRKSIRRSILSKSKASEETSANTESSFKDAQDEGPQQSSLVVNQGSIDSSHISKSSNTTIKVSLNDGPKDTISNTPSHNRQSQGFALLPHRDPLTVKSAKKKSIEDTEYQPNDAEEENNSPSTKLSPLIFKPSLYPEMNFQNEPDAPKEISPQRDLKSTEAHHQASPSKIPVGKRPLNDTLTQSKPPLAYSPPKEKVLDTGKQSTNSPLSSLFATVGSTLRKARNKFTRDQDAGQLKVDQKSKVHKPRKSSSTSPKLVSESPSKRILSNNEDVLSRLTAPTEASQAKSAKRVISGTSNTVAESPTKNNNERSSLKFSPVKSIYGSLRLEMNKSVNNSPSKKKMNHSPKKQLNDEFKGDEQEKKEDTRKSQSVKFASGQPKSLTRMSLSKPQKSENNIKENNQSRKSAAKGGLASMPLEQSSKNLNRFRPKSLVSGEHQPLKRKTQTEEEIKNTSTAHQPYRKIGTKIVAPSIAQSKQQQDAKRRRTADQLQSVLQKRASRVSNTRHDHPTIDQKFEEETTNESNEISKPPIPQIVQPQPPQPAARVIPQTINKHPKQVPNTQTLMKTAVLQHARMNNDNSKGNAFQNGSLSKSSSSITPVTPKATTVLPEIFSESDDDEEGSVLKDWANSPELRNILINQQHIDPDQVFGPMAPLHMEDIFKNSRLSRFRGRGSSAQWSGKDGLTIQEIENYKLQKTYKK